MILFTIALPMEAKVIKQEIKNISLKGLKIDTLVNGVGVLNTVYSIKNYIEKGNKPDFIVNIGVCGKKDETHNDFFQAYRIKNLSNQKESLCPIYVKNLSLKSLACSDKIITDINEIGDENFVDMESFGIDFICDKEKIPYIIIKKPFDVVSKDSLKVEKGDLEKSLQGFDYETLLSQIQDFLNQNKKDNFENIIQNIKEHFRLTFSETEMLKKHINKEIAFGNTQEGITKGFEELSKNEFLENIKK